MIGNQYHSIQDRSRRFGANRGPSWMKLLLLYLLVRPVLSAAQPSGIEPNSSSTPAALEKYVIFESLSSKNCPPSMLAGVPEDLHKRIYRNLPRDLTRLNKLIPEDLDTYLASQVRDFFDPDRATTRSDENILRVIRSINLKWFLYIQIQCEAGMYRWEGTAIDQKMISSLLQCKDIGVSDENLKVCNPLRGSEDARRHGTVFTDNLKDQEVGRALRELFIQFLSKSLLHIDLDKQEFLPNSSIEPFLTLTEPENDETDEPSSSSDVQIRYDLFELPDDQAVTLCAYPSRIRWRRKCDDKSPSPPAADVSEGPRHIRCGVLHATQERISAKGQVVAGAKITISAPPYTARILVRAAAYDASGEHQQTPTIYRCFDVRPPAYYLGIAVHYGLPYDINFHSSESTFPPASVLPNGFGFQLEAGTRMSVYRRQSRWLSSVYLGGALGFHKFQGYYPCPARQYPDCQDPLVIYRSLVTSSISQAVDLRLAFRTDVVRFWKMAVVLDGDMGFGLEILSSQGTPFRNDGVHGIFASRLGVGLALGGGFSGRTSVRGVLLASVESRARLGRTFNTETTNIYRTEAAGVPDSLFTVWFSYLAHFFIGPKIAEGNKPRI